MQVVAANAVSAIIKSGKKEETERRGSERKERKKKVLQKRTIGRESHEDRFCCYRVGVM